MKRSPQVALACVVAVAALVGVVTVAEHPDGPSTFERTAFAKPKKAKPKASASAASTAPAGGRAPHSGSCDNTNNTCSGKGESCKDNSCFCTETGYARCSKPTESDVDCTYLGSNGDHCGRCGHKCAPNRICAEGDCVACDRGQSVCFHDYCANLQDDVGDCGKCGHLCPSGWQCSRGQCAP